jgi:DNA-binding transcriptional regulator YdaS (Cro superfamily)
MSLSQQEKLALMMTSAGSQRNLASLLGVTHQTLGRWLKSDYVDPAGRLIVERDASGRRAGVKEIPREASAAINAAFSFHKQVTREQAKIDRVPYDPNFPIFYERPKSRIDGKPSLRFVAKQTQFIHPQLRRDVITSVAATGKVFAFSVRSMLDLYLYLNKLLARASAFTDNDEDVPQALQQQIIKFDAELRKGGAKRLDKEFSNQEDTYVSGSGKSFPTLRAAFNLRVQNKDKKANEALVSTKMGDLTNMNRLPAVINTIEKKLQERHSPNALPNGFANQFVFQLKENQNVNKPPAKRKPTKRKK